MIYGYVDAKEPVLARMAAKRALGYEASGTANLQMKRLRAMQPSKVLICAAQKKLMAEFDRRSD